MNNNYTSLSEWREKEKTALDLLKLSGDLRFDKSIELVIFRNPIFDISPSKLIGFHKEAANFGSESVDIFLSYEIAQAIGEISNLNPSRIDIGKLAVEFKKSKQTGLSSFVTQALSNLEGQQADQLESKDVILYGFGRIGRLVARILIGSTGRGEQLRLRAVVIRSKMKNVHEELEKRMSLFVTDSIHGTFDGTYEINTEESTVTINGNTVNFIFASSPQDIDYGQYGIQDALVIDNTGVWRDQNSLEQHLGNGATKVILTAPGKDIPNIVYGINQDEIDIENDNVLCAASCTTNAIAPLMKVVDERYGINKGHIETIHAYTSDQNLLDNFHKKPRRGRAAAINMVLTSTGAATAVTKVLPSLKDKLTGNAVRVPTPNVSLAIMQLEIQNSTNQEELADFLRDTALQGSLVEQIHYSESTEYVSSHAIGMTSTSVLDAPSTKVSNDGKSIVLYAWYDNEYGYCCQVVRLAKHVAKVRRQVYY